MKSAISFADFVKLVAKLMISQIERNKLYYTMNNKVPILTKMHHKYVFIIKNIIDSMKFNTLVYY